MEKPNTKKTRLKTPRNPELERSLALAREMARIAEEKKGADITIRCVAELVSYADYFVFVTAANRRQVQAIADAVEASIGPDGGKVRVEGYASGWWVLLDHSGVILDVFQPDARAFYGLDHLWADAPVVAAKDPAGQRQRSRIATET